MLDRRSSRSFSPLFVGAVVAMQAGRVTREGRTGFSPLFVGAGVAIELPGWLVMHWRVSVPFLSGQALQFCRGIASPPSRRFQSPICRGRRCNRRQVSGSTAVWCFSPLFVGAGVAIASVSPDGRWIRVFQSPICRGRRCNSPPRCTQRPSARFQSPICRARLQTLETRDRQRPSARFQSPICRGRRCNSPGPHRSWIRGSFQSPICRGRLCNIS